MWDEGYGCHSKYFRIIPFILEVLGSGAAPTINWKVSFLEIQMFLEVLARNQEYDKGRITVVSYFNESVILNILMY